MAFSTDKTILDSLKRQADESIRNAEKIKRLVDDIIHKEEEKNKIEEEKNKIEEEKKKIEEENKKLEEEKKKIEEENKKLKEENKKLEEEANTKQKAQLATRTKTKTKTTKFDIDATPVEDELSEILEDHFPPMKAWVGGNLKEKYCGIENKFKTLKEAHDYYLTTLKEKIDEDDVKYGGIMKCTSGYMLKPNKAKGEIIEYLPNWTPKQCPTHYKKWIFWNYEHSGLKTKAERRAMRANK